MFRTLERYVETGLGLPYPVVLINAAEEEIDDQGNPVGVSIPDMDQLVAVVSVCRALNPLRLHGSEVRFIRHALGFTAKDFASALIIDAATLSRWENGKQEVGEWAEKQVRYAALIGLRDRVPGLTCDQKDLINLRVHERREGDAWPEMVIVRGPAEQHQNTVSDADSEPTYDACISLKAA